ncbi:guanylate kinase [Candidatus Pantoea carbekii]|uniref:Guanylate kinase n=1 Tax=Candidatus Pantoea carbekii TaxID=1235990 RepID=U3U724_9GAMM|nr:guanylate kinase [Candidatus Pantoea carbekii]AKC32331.1 guanylate kinase Gmk [Candidatus Pantoea carbekii]BAO00049.1 Gmk protein [Candidatus Pantoea carbekii]
MIQGTFYIISAPSGAGKSLLLQRLLKEQLLRDIKLSISYTTRSIRPNETDGKDYFFVSKHTFKNMIAEDAFLEYAKVFGNYYGTSRESVKEILSSGIDVFLDIDWQGAKQIRTQFLLTCSIFVLPPSIQELARRLNRRAQDTEQVITQRMKQAIIEITHYSEYDYLIINDDLESALTDLKTIIYAQRLRVHNQKVRHNTLISKLLVV